MGRSAKGNVVLEKHLLAWAVQEEYMSNFEDRGPSNQRKGFRQKGRFSDRRSSREELNKFNKEMGYAGDVANFPTFKELLNLLIIAVNRFQGCLSLDQR